MSEILLQLERVCKYYTASQSVVVGLNEVELSFRRGEFVAVTGESGSGKSTLAQVVSGILPYESGEMRIGGRPTSHYDGSDWERYRREKVSYISQNYGILPGSTVLTNVVSALRIQGMDKAEALARAGELLEMVDLWQLRSRRAAKLSSGQKQRLSIARALAKPAPILVADEPTGNLDRENSAKVIRLLAEAARERLVILITHDFQEAEGFATRRISLQDGKVTTDAPLDGKIEPAAPAEAKSAGKNRGLSGYITGLQIAGRPVWSGLVGLFFALTAFAVFAFLGTFIMNLDDTSTRIYDDSAFPNGDKTRIVVQRLDGGPFTPEDYEALLEADYVRALERNSYLADWQYAWQQDVDYLLHYHVLTEGNEHDNDKKKTVSMELLPGACDFLQTVPLLPAGQEFLTAGRLPETMYEAVLAGGQERLGEKITVYYRDEKTMSVAAYVKLEVTVVGVTDYGSGLYFGEEFSHVIRNYVENGGADAGMLLAAPLYDMPYKTVQDGAVDGAVPKSEWQVVLGMAGDKLYGFETLPVYLQHDPDTPLEQCLRDELEVLAVSSFMDGIAVNTCTDSELPRFVLDREAMEGFAEEELDSIQRMLDNIYYRVRDYNESTWVTDYYLGDTWSCALSETMYHRGFRNVTFGVDLLKAAGYHDSTFVGYALVTKEAFDTLVSKDNPNQVSVYIEDYAYTDRVLEQLQKMGYLALSPFQQGSTQKDPTLAKQRMQTLTVCLAALAAVVILQLVVLKELFGVQKDSYKLLADMGLSCGAASRSLCWQVLAFTLAGQLLGFGTISVCAGAGVRRIAGLMRYLPAEKWAILSLTHLAVSLLVSLWIMKDMKRSVYPQTGERGDLDLEGEEAV